MEWNEFVSELKHKIKELTKNELDEGSLQFEKIIADTLLESFIKEGIIERKQLPYNEIKKTNGKFILRGEKDGITK